MIFQWFKPHRSHYFSPRFVGPKKGHWDFLTFRNILWRDVTRGCSHLALGWYSQAGVGSAKVTKEESLFFFNTIIESTLEYEIFEMTLWFQYVYSFDLLAFWKDVWDFWVWLSDGRTKSSSNIWKARVFFGTHSPPTRRIGPGRKPCENFDPFRKRAPALFVFGSVDWARNRSSWTAGNQPISVNCGNFWGGFGKVSEVFGFGALWSLWGKGTTYYLSRVLCFCCEIQSVFFVNVKEPKEMRILQKWLLTLIFVLHICSKDKSGN